MRKPKRLNIKMDGPIYEMRKPKWLDIKMDGQRKDTMTCTLLSWNISMKYQWELYLSDLLFLFFPKDWRDYNYGKPIWALCSRTYTSLAEFNLAVLSYIRQSAKLTSPPIFHAILWYKWVCLRVNHALLICILPYTKLSSTLIPTLYTIPTL